MSDQYTAWDGNDYPWPPPEGWVLGNDGRYWPADQLPEAAAAPATPDPGSMPPPAAMPPPAPAATPPPMGAAPPGAPQAAYSSVPPPGPQAPGTVTYGAPQAKSSKAGWWILGILLFLMVIGVGGCVLIASVFADGVEEFSDSLEEFEDDFTRRNEAEQAISVASCAVEGGVPKATGTVTNTRSVDSSYFIQIEFFETSTGLSLGTADTSIFDISEGSSEPWELVAPQGGIEGAVQCVRSTNSIRIAD